jgi:hypothetical protein
MIILLETSDKCKNDQCPTSQECKGNSSNYKGRLCRNPTLAKCGGEAQHSQSWGLGILQDSRMFRVRQQGPKLLALNRSWRHWKGLEVYISKMASHWPFGHLQPKLWAKEGSGVKLAV